MASSLVFHWVILDEKFYHIKNSHRTITYFKEIKKKKKIQYTSTVT